MNHARVIVIHYSRPDVLRVVEEECHEPNMVTYGQGRR
jgi:hypothetical protein